MAFVRRREGKDVVVGRFTCNIKLVVKFQFKIFERVIIWQSKSSLTGKI